jgi:lysophospholipase L1-like esterase
VARESSLAGGAHEESFVVQHPGCGNLLARGGPRACISNRRSDPVPGRFDHRRKRGRTADPNHILGHGYAFLIAAKYGAMLPERKLVFLNRGISGNTVLDLAARWQTDTLDLKPDVLSILIGINDTSRHIPAEEFEAAYDKLLVDSLAASPKLKLVLCEPFTLPGGRYQGQWEEWRAEVRKRQEATTGLAEKYHATLVRFQKVFDDAAGRAPADYWIWDGIHPTYSGHQLMADEWERTVLGQAR